MSDEVLTPAEIIEPPPSHEFTDTPTEMKPEDYSPEDLAAAFFTLNHKRLLQGLSHMSKRQLIRVCYHVCCMGLQDTKAQLQDDVEKRCAYVMNEMITNRVIMQLHAEMDKADKAAQAELTSVDKNDIIKPSLETLGEQKLENKDG